MGCLSPDGILTKNTVVEIKCPATENTLKNYLNNNKIAEKFYAQIQLQMHVTGFKKGLFCVASPNFETNNEIYIKNVDYDESYTSIS